MTLQPAQADAELIRHVLDESRVDQTVAPPSWTGYAEVIAEALATFIARLLDPLARVLGPEAARWVGWGLLAILLALTLWLAARWGLAALRRRSRRPAAVVQTPLSPRAPSSQDAQQWRQEARQRLDSGDASGALEAAWWWLARSLHADAVETSWTSREVVVRAGRHDLLSLTRTLDRLTWRAGVPARDEVAALLASLSRSLA